MSRSQPAPHNSEEGPFQEAKGLTKTCRKLSEELTTGPTLNHVWSVTAGGPHRQSDELAELVGEGSESACTSLVHAEGAAGRPEIHKCLLRARMPGAGFPPLGSRQGLQKWPV